MKVKPSCIGHYASYVKCEVQVEINQCVGFADQPESYNGKEGCIYK